MATTGEPMPAQKIQRDPATGNPPNPDRLQARWEELRRWIIQTAAASQHAIIAATLDEVVEYMEHLEGARPVFDDWTQVNLPDGVWRPVGDEDLPGGEKAKLTTSITIADTRMHLDAWQVDPDARSLQAALQDDTGLSEVAAGVGADGRFETTTIDGHEYVIVATPYC